MSTTDTTPLADKPKRKSRKNPYTKALRKMNKQIIVQHNDEDAVKDIKYKRLVIKLTPRELEKFSKLLKYISNDPYYDTREKILDFDAETHLARNNILTDEVMDFLHYK